MKVSCHKSGSIEAIEHIMQPILVVDDDLRIREFICSALSSEGYLVLSAANGEVALKIILEHKPSLVILDMAMPVMDGKTFLTRYCQTSGAHIPMIGMSAGEVVADELPCMTKFLAKPLNLEELLGLVETYAV
jgi:CheY-like chemotaxis protein